MTDRDDAPHPSPRDAALEARLGRLERRLRDLERLVARPRPIEPATLYTCAEVAQALRCGVSTVYTLARAGHLRRVEVGPSGKGFRFLGADLIAFLARPRGEDRVS